MHYSRFETDRQAVCTIHPDYFHHHLHFCIFHVHTAFLTHSCCLFLHVWTPHTLVTHTLSTHSLSSSRSLCHTIHSSLSAPSIFPSLCFSELSFRLVNYAPISLSLQGSSEPVRTHYKDTHALTHRHTHRFFSRAL